MTDQKYKLVPVEPTGKMTKAAMGALPPSLHRLGMVSINAAIRHAIAAAPEQPGPWQPIETAPKDGTQVLLLVEFEDHATEDSRGPSRTIGSNNDDNVGEDEHIGWQFAGWCWSHDHYTEGTGNPVGWMPMPAVGEAAPEPVCRWTPAKRSLGLPQAGWFWPGCTDRTATRIGCVNSGCPGPMSKPKACPHCGKKVEVVGDA